MTRAIHLTLALPLLLPLLLGACHRHGAQPSAAAEAPLDHYPGTLASTQTLTDTWDPFMARQKVTAELGHQGGKTVSFEGVLQLRDGELLLLGLTPMGTKAFAIHQRGEDIELEPFTDEPLPFEPRDILLDIHRTLFLTVPGAPHPDGEVHVERANERITERWHDGRLQQRRFQRLDGRPKGEITITYDPPVEPHQVPKHADLHNPWFDYHLHIDTLALNPLQPPPPAD